MLLFIYYTFYISYDSHKQIFKIIFKLELKAYKNDIPILICCNNEIFIECFLLVFERVSLLDAC